MKTKALLVLASVVFCASVKAEGPKVAKAQLIATTGNKVTGSVMFYAESEGVRVKGEVSGLTPGKHGFHVHQIGDCSSGDGKSAGGHFNPENVNHGSPSGEEKHIGDLGNIVANSEGLAKVDQLLSFLSLEGDHSIVGRGLIVHEKEDDLSTQPTGAAGARVACGVIGVVE
jgi:Cu-Zn family superoxide dismutase